MTKIVRVEGMACPRCEARVKTALEAVPGVQEAKADHNTNTAVVTLTADVADSALLDAVNALGKFKAVAVE